MVIRRVSEDFVVNERLDPAYARGLVPTCEPGSTLAVYVLRKSGLTTPEALAHLGKALGVRHAAIQYAGLKDKHALTEQHVAVPLVKAGEARAQSAPVGSVLPERAEGPAGRWQAKLMGFTAAELTAEAITGNGFAITIRQAPAEQIDEMRRRAALLSEADGSGALVVNYFGDQRFGSARHGQGFAARRLIEGDFDGALRLLIGTPSRKDSGATREFTRLCAEHWGKWKLLAKRLPGNTERRAIEALAEGASPAEAFAALPYFLQQMCVEAYQSLLWNGTARVLAERIASQGAAEAPEPKNRKQRKAARRTLLRSDDTFGEMLFPTQAVLSGAAGDVWRGLEVPLPGPETKLLEPWGKAMAGVLEAEGLTLERLTVPGLRRPFFGEAGRRLLVRASGLSIGEPARDELADAEVSGAKKGKKGGKRPRAGAGAVAAVQHKVEVRFELPRGSYATVVLRAMGQ